MVLKMCNPTLMHRTVPDGVDISAEYMFDENLLQDSPMSAFFRGKTFFITGGTGFLGQLFIERLLRSGAKFVYVLCRPMKGESPENRIQEMLAGSVFAKLSAVDPMYANRVKIITGDLSLPNLGISRGDEFDLCQKVEIVIHAAVSTSKSDPLLSALICNLRGTRDLLALCEQMSVLSLFVQMSSAYAHISPEYVLERFYDAPLNPELLITMVENLQGPQDQEALLILMQKIISPSQNLQMFTKILTEELVRQFSDRIAVTVVRPSLVLSTSEDPMPGWIDTSIGINTILAGIGFGSIRTIRYNTNVDIDLICADYVINSTLAIIWDVCRFKSTTDLIPKPKIFHITNGEQNPISTSSLISSLTSVCHDVPLMQNIWYPFVIITRFDLVYKIFAFFLHILPAILIDKYYRWQNMKSENLKYFRKQHLMVQDISSIYNKMVLRVVNENCLTIYNRMTDYDKILFPNDISSMNWRQYIYEYALGARLYMQNEPFETIQPAKHRNVVLKKIHYSTVAMFLVCGVFIIRELIISHY